MASASRASSTTRASSCSSRANLKLGSASANLRSSITSACLIARRRDASSASPKRPVRVKYPQGNPD
ncbi:hypothetical protein [Vibrio gallaecicus]|uniref:hypothetical protein n=1 Tax=Vibrio gallaecicus TaxID=552386 RepID=UPI0025B455AE|nr:hypothetical protein [Vibrio gallaecicus]MDN3615784.1 hypothetical protein [Vibrio gallaecicus]